MKTMTIDEFRAALKAQGVPIEHWAFRCPMCGTIQSAHDLITSGAGSDFDTVEKYLGFSCVGRWTGQSDEGIVAHNAGKPWDKGCDWFLGGLFRCHKLEVVTPDGKKHPRFEFCTPEEAQAHMKRLALVAL